MGSGDSMDLLLSIGDAVQVIEPNDQKKVQGEQEKAKSLRHEQACFQREWASKRVQVRAPVRPCLNSRAKAKARKEAQSRGERIFPDKLPVGGITQSQLTSLCPPGGFIWTDHRKGGFQAQFPPFPRVSKLWHLHGGSRLAALLCLQYLWESWSVDTGVPKEQCPIGDLWASELTTDATLVPRGGAASSSSGRA